MKKNHKKKEYAINSCQNLSEEDKQKLSKRKKNRIAACLEKNYNNK